MEIKVLTLDLDGVLNSGLYFVSDNGTITKSFYTRDFAALEKMVESDIKIIIITSSTDSCILRKIQQLSSVLKNCISVFYGIKNKLEKMNNLLQEWRLSWDNVAYMGDSENDLECIKVSKISGCPLDAQEIIKKEVDFVSCKNGGCGCVEDFVNYLEKREKK